jgi:hypothetical protein
VKMCKSCKRGISLYDEFPGGLCIECWGKTIEANRPITAQELARMWGGK